MLVSRSKKKETDFILPVKIGDYFTHWYYDDSNTLFKAYYQLKRINGKIKAYYPIIISDDKQLRIRI